MRGLGLQPTGWTNGPGERYGAHDHPYDKVIVVERGSIRFGLPVSGEVMEMTLGERLELPARTTHEALVGPGGVACLEVHLPAGTLAKPALRSADAW